MSTKTFNGRLQLKGDALSAWSQANPVLLKNEIAIVTVPAESGTVAQEPAVLFKVGDGTTAFNDLPFVSGKAADVYDWAKAAAKPTYTASEISGLADYISGQIEDTDTQYKLEQDSQDGHKLILSSKTKGTEQWTAVATITTVDTVYDDTALKGRVGALETLVGEESVANQIATAIEALNLATTYVTKEELDTVKGDVKKNTNAIAVLNGEGEGSVSKQVADAVAKILDDVDGDYDTLKEIAAWITGHADSASAMNLQINANKAAIADLEALVGELDDDEAETVVEYINKLIGEVKGSIPTGALASKDKVAKADLDESLKDELEGKVNDSALAAIAKSGNVNDLAQSDGDYIIINCGSATTVI